MRKSLNRGVQPKIKLMFPFTLITSMFNLKPKKENVLSEKHQPLIGYLMVLHIRYKIFGIVISMSFNG